MSTRYSEIQQILMESATDDQLSARVFFIRANGYREENGFNAVYHWKSCMQRSKRHARYAREEMGIEPLGSFDSHLWEGAASNHVTEYLHDRYFVTL